MYDNNIIHRRELEEVEKQMQDMKEEKGLTALLFNEKYIKLMQRAGTLRHLINLNNQRNINLKH